MTTGRIPQEDFKNLDIQATSHLNQVRISGGVRFTHQHFSYSSLVIQCIANIKKQCLGDQEKTTGTQINSNCCDTEKGVSVKKIKVAETGKHIAEEVYRERFQRGVSFKQHLQSCYIPTHVT